MLASPTPLYVAIAAILLSVVGLAVGAVRYIRAINVFYKFVLENGPNLWTSLLSPQDWDRTASVIPFEWIWRVMLGIRTLDIPGERYGQLLWTARKWLIVCACFWMAGIVGLGWLFRILR